MKRITTLALAMCAAAPIAASAQSLEDKWQFDAILYAYLPDIGGSTNFPARVLGGWRYLDYRFKSDSKVQDLNFNGPMLGVAFSW